MLSLNILSLKGATFLSLHEGFVGRWYADPGGVGTIGIGFTWRSTEFRKWWRANKPGIKFGPGARMTRQEAQEVLQLLVTEEYGKAVNEFFGRKVPQHVFDGTASAVFNLGPGSLKWRWAAPLKDGKWAAGARILAGGYNTQDGRRLPGLVRRRKEEALLIAEGIYTGVDAHQHAKTDDPLADGLLVRREAGEPVAKLIRDLAELGYYDGVMDDVFGYGTEAAVMDLQRAANIDVDGKVGPDTFKAIAEALARKRAADNGKAPPPVAPPPPPPPTSEPVDQAPFGDTGDQRMGNVTIVGVVVTVLAFAVYALTGVDITALMGN